jgi:tubulin monoglycylase TTLL3/8
MKRLATDAMRACSGGIDPSKLGSNFEVFGMDFMIDANLDVWLIEINSNPCLELSCPLLASLIPKMVENALELTLDAYFPPPVRYSPKGVHYFK